MRHPVLCWLPNMKEPLGLAVFIVSLSHLNRCNLFTLLEKLFFFCMIGGPFEPTERVS